MKSGNWTLCLISWFFFCDEFLSHLSQSTGENLLILCISLSQSKSKNRFILCVQYSCFSESMVKEDRDQGSWAMSLDIEKEKNQLYIYFSSCLRSCTKKPWFLQHLIFRNWLNLDYKRLLGNGTFYKIYKEVDRQGPPKSL